MSIIAIVVSTVTVFQMNLGPGEMQKRGNGSATIISTQIFSEDKPCSKLNFDTLVKTVEGTKVAKVLSITCDSNLVYQK